MPKVLVVDDDTNCREVLKDALDGEGYSISEAVDGRDALRAVAEDPPDLILLDVTMDGMDGLQVCRRLKEGGDTPGIPIIMVTARDSEQDVLAGLESGATDYVTKPFSGTVVRARVRAALRSKLAHDEVEQLAAQVAAKNCRLAELVDTASRFVDDVSHEFRTPLTVIKDYASIIADGLAGGVTQEQREFLQIITNAVHDLSRMVDDLLDSSKLKAGSLRVDRRPHRVEDILESVRPMIASKAKSKDIKVAERTRPGLPTVFADKEKAGRVIINLAVNAIKFSPEGSEMTIWAEGCENGDVEVGVTDQGKGMSPEERAVVFERFRQVGGAVGSKNKGFGLGLNIAREMIWLNLGRVHVASKPGQGSTFSFTLPRDDPATILTRYCDRLADANRPLDLVAALCIAPVDSKPPREELRGFLTSTCYPMDLVLDCGDGNSLIAIGRTSEPDRWIGRLQETWDSVIGDRPDEKRPTIQIDHIGSWSHRSLKDMALSGLLRELRREAACAR
jgi:signal transduction histidine kinase